MKIGLISDIHSNYNFLLEVMEHLENEKVDKIYCLGDLVGYYDKPNEVISFIKNNKIESVIGNHDSYILEKLKYNLDRDDLYRIGFQKDILSIENRNFLDSLPMYIETKIENKNYLFTHSFPNNCENYIYNPNEIDKSIIQDVDYYCFGHTHIPMITFYYGTMFINPGSIGQTRDYTKKSSYAIIDTDLDSAYIRKVGVNSDSYTNLLINHNFNKQVIDILNRTNK